MAEIVLVICDRCQKRIEGGSGHRFRLTDGYWDSNVPKTSDLCLSCHDEFLAWFEWPMDAGGIAKVEEPPYIDACLTCDGSGCPDCQPELHS